MVWTINQRVFITSSHRTLRIFPVNMGSLSGIRARDPLLQSLERWGLKAAQLPGVNGALEEETGRLDLGVIGSHGKSREVGSDLWWFLGFHPWKMVGSWIFWMEILGGSSHGSEFGICWVNFHAEKASESFRKSILTRVTNQFLTVMILQLSWWKSWWEKELPRTSWLYAEYCRMWLESLGERESNFQWTWAWSRGHRFTHLIV